MGGRGGLRGLLDATPAGRDRYVDFLRVMSIATVVLGHWTLTAVGRSSDGLAAGNVLSAAQVAQELLDQAGLAHPGSAEHDREDAAAPADGLFHGAAKKRELGASADHRRIQVASMACHVGSDAEQPERGNRLALALQRKRRHRLDGHRVADEPPGPLADEDLPGTRRLLQPSGHVHRVSNHHVLPVDHVADYDLPCVHTGPQREAHTQRRL
jgi:hypothetical protein